MSSGIDYHLDSSGRRGVTRLPGLAWDIVDEGKKRKIIESAGHPGLGLVMIEDIWGDTLEWDKSRRDARSLALPLTNSGTPGGGGKGRCGDNPSMLKHRREKRLHAARLRKGIPKVKSEKCLTEMQSDQAGKSQKIKLWNLSKAER